MRWTPLLVGALIGAGIAFFRVKQGNKMGG